MDLLTSKDPLNKRHLSIKHTYFLPESNMLPESYSDVSVSFVSLLQKTRRLQRECFPLFR